MTDIIPVILCGGSGTRLWPASREAKPKQFLNLMDDKSLLQNTALRALRVSGAKASHVVTVTLDTFAKDVEEQFAAIDPAMADHILQEPQARNTAAAVAFAAAYVAKTFGENTLMWILPADHHMGDEEALAHAFRHARASAEEGKLVTFGIKAARPETGYGYIRLGASIKDNAIYKAEAFVEKPNLETAKTYVEAGNYLWNSGMFLFSTMAVLAEYAAHAPKILTDVEMAMDGAPKGQTVPALYKAVDEAPFDVAIMEKSNSVTVVPCDPAWSDIGAWESLWEIRNKDENGNVLEGNAVSHATKNCLVHAETRLIAVAGCENLVIIETGDAILIADRSNSDALRALVKTLKKDGRPEVSRAPQQPLVKFMAVGQDAQQDDDKIKAA